MLIKRTERQARRASLSAALAEQNPGTRPPRIPAPLRPRGRLACRRRRAAARQHAQGRGRPAARARRSRHAAQEHVHALLGRLHRDGRSVERRVDRPGARLGFADQSRLALRQGRGDARARAQRPPPALPDEDGQRPVDAGFLGSGHQRDRRQADGDPREVGTGFGLLARLGEVHQRRRLSQSQVRGVLGHEQFGPPGAHLSLDHRRGRSQYLGLRRDDQQLQRHPQRQDHDHHGRQSRRGASGVAAAPAGGQGAQPREHHRDRSAHDPHRRACDRICAHPLRHRHSGDLRACCGTSSRTAGRTRSSSSSASTAWTTSARRSRSGRRKRSSASPACRARSSSASPRCSRPRSPRR